MLLTRPNREDAKDKGSEEATVKHPTSDFLTACLNSGLCQMLLTRFKIEDAKSEVSKEVVNKKEPSAFRGAFLNEVWHGALPTGASFQVLSDIVVYHTGQLQMVHGPYFGA